MKKVEKVIPIAAAVIFAACGGGGAAPPSAPQLPTGAAPPASPPSSPSQPQPPASTPPTQPTSPTPPAPSAPAAPSSATIQTPNRTFSPSNVTIGVNGSVTWQATGDRHTIRFTSAAPPGGNPGEVEEGTSVTRTFPAAGTYEYECERHRDKGMRGTVVVQQSAAPSPPQSPPQSPPPSSPPPATPSVTVTTPNATFAPSSVTIPTGGSVTWQFSEARHNVTFQGPTPPGGSVPDQEAGTSASRTFTAPGTYDYVCSRHSGMTGRVVVQ